MLDKPDQQRDLRYAGYVALLVFFGLLLTYMANQRLLAFWIGFFAAAPTFVVTYVLFRISRLLGRLTGLSRPVVQVRERIMDRISAIVEELEEEVEDTG